MVLFTQGGQPDVFLPVDPSWSNNADGFWWTVFGEAVSFSRFQLAILCGVRITSF
jgi:hypothetical protein